MNRFNNRVPEFVVPKVPPKIDRVTSKDFKSMLETIPDNLTVYINGKLVTEINELNIKIKNPPWRKGWEQEKRQFRIFISC